MANSVVHFEIFADDVERARRFYERVFGWTFEVGGPPDFYLIATGPATDPGITHGLIAKRRGSAAAGALNSFRCTISVRSIDESMAAIQAAGGTIRGAMVDIPHVGKVAEFADTEGNIACVMEYVPGHALAVRESR
ncbi:MAG TPA: VOC family protein [Steroidobacteraceae bacterium]|jgi:predicted enzyme related to lactoylglutathione lyase|nr:VOC family protein [Steroidobacteraceae bacterium]